MQHTAECVSGGCCCTACDDHTFLGQGLDRVECRHNRRRSRFLYYDVARDVHGHTDVGAQLFAGARIPRAHEQILAFSTCLRTQHAADIRLGEDRETLSSQGKARANHGLIVALGNVRGVAILGHLHYGTASMPLLAIPNVSEGRRSTVIDALAGAVGGSGGTVLDSHSDAVHNRTVFTVAGDIPKAMSELAAAACEHIDLTAHRGVHPRLGVLDVCPIVPYRETIDDAIALASATAEEITRRTTIPIFLYGEAARRPETRNVADLRRGGLAALVERMRKGLAPDLGPAVIDPRLGVVCVGARGPLIAFNVWLGADLHTARLIARRVRTAGGGPKGVRALGLPIDEGVAQVSMNLTSPEDTGIDQAFEAVERTARPLGAQVTATEIVGLVEGRFLPDPKKQAARLLMAPGRSIESVLGA